MQEWRRFSICTPTHEWQAPALWTDSDIVFKIALGLVVNKIPDQESPRLHLRRNSPRLKGRLQMPKCPKAPTSSDKKSKGKRKPKGRDKKNKPSTETGNVDFDDAEHDVPEEEETQEWAGDQEDPEVYFADAQASDSEADCGCMPNCSASECMDYKCYSGTRVSTRYY